MIKRHVKSIKVQGACAADTRDMMEPFSEAEIQLLIALLEVTLPIETPNNNFYRFYPHDLDEAATYFRKYYCDWSPAYASLTARGLVQLAENDLPTQAKASLTQAGIDLAQQFRKARPPIWYWYKEYYAEAPLSPTYAKFCQLLYGKDLCQTNFSDMAQLECLLNVTALGPDNRVLDLGCGIGMITEYIADMTMAHITGMDYVPDAIELALARTVDKRNRMDFQVGNLDRVPFLPHTFDTLIAIDTLYMPNNLDDTLAQMREILQPGGQMAIFYSHMLWDAQSTHDDLSAERTPLGQALARVGLPYSTVDFSAATYQHLQHKRQIAIRLEAEFAAEGRTFLYDYILAESESSTSAFDPAVNRMSRYLYHVIN